MGKTKKQYDDKMTVEEAFIFVADLIEEAKEKETNETVRRVYQRLIFALRMSALHVMPEDVFGSRAPNSPDVGHA